jgi:hypothetical protein
MASAIFRMDKDCHPSSFTICHAVLSIPDLLHPSGAGVFHYSMLFSLTVLAKVVPFGIARQIFFVKKRLFEEWILLKAGLGQLPARLLFLGIHNLFYIGK